MDETTTKPLQKRWKVETTAMTRRVYEVEAQDADDAEAMVANDLDVSLVHEEDINEDIDSVHEIASAIRSRTEGEGK